MGEHELCLSLGLGGMVVTFILTHYFTTRAYRKEYTEGAIAIFNHNAAEALRRDFDARR